jgi:DNA-binding GntR family transcriptional regulator
VAIIPGVATRRGWKVYALSLEDIREIFEIKQLVDRMMVRKAAGCQDEELWRP